MLVLWIFLGVLLLLTVADVAVGRWFVNSYLRRKPYIEENDRFDNVPEQWREYIAAAREGLAWMDTQYTEKCEITSFDGLKLRAVFFPAAGKTAATILCIHGYTGTGRQDFGAYLRFLHMSGCNVLLPDNRAHGVSEGKFIGFSNLDRRDCLDWCRYLSGRFGDDCKVLLFGISMGAATVLSASGDASLPACVCGVIGDCGFSSGWNEMKYQMKAGFHLPPFPTLYTADLLLRISAGYSLRENSAVEMVKNTKIPMLIIHGLSDDYVPTHMGEEIFSAASCDKRLLLVRGATHAQSYKTDPAAYEKAFTELAVRAGMPWVTATVG